jgi:hypothetical protein
MKKKNLTEFKDIKAFYKDLGLLVLSLLIGT